MLKVLMNPSVKVANYSASLLEAKPERCEGVFSRIADSFEDDLLEFDEFPPEYFGLALSLRKRAAKSS